MIPISPFRVTGRCRVMLSAGVLCAVVSLASCGTTAVYQQSPAEDRGGWMDGLSSLNPFASAPPPPAYNIPDVAGFGMYPLWKFHKFDGLSLRPVPYGVDIGSGLPAPPSPPAYPVNFLSSPSSPAGTGPPMKNAYPAPQVTNYEQSPLSNLPAAYNGGSASSPTGYGSQQNPHILNYVPSGPPQYEQAATNNYPSNAPAPISVAYQPQKYEQPAPASYSGPASYSAPATTSYGEPQGYASPPASPSYGAPMSPPAGYDGGMGGITIQFSAPQTQDYGQPVYASPTPQGSYQKPSYNTLENPISVSYQPDQKPMDAGYGNGGGYYKRSSPSFENEATKKMGTEPEDIISNENSFSA